MYVRESGLGKGVEQVRAGRRGAYIRFCRLDRIDRGGGGRHGGRGNHEKSKTNATFRRCQGNEVVSARLQEDGVWGGGGYGCEIRFLKHRRCRLSFVYLRDFRVENTVARRRVQNARSDSFQCHVSRVTDSYPHTCFAEILR